MKIYVKAGAEDIFVESNPKTSPSRLRELAASPNLSVKRMIAYNPSTPPDVLDELVEEEDDILRAGVYKNPNTDEALRELLQEYFEGRGLSVMRAFHIKPRSKEAFANTRIRRRRRIRA
jgi:hypothetical protein